MLGRSQNDLPVNRSKGPYKRASNANLITRAVKGAISQAMLKQYVDISKDDEGDKTEANAVLQKNQSKASVWTSMLSPTNGMLPAISTNFMPGTNLIHIKEEGGVATEHDHTTSEKLEKKSTMPQI